MFLGQPTEIFFNAEKAVLEGMEAGLEKAKAGNLCEDIANAFLNKYVGKKIIHQIPMPDKFKKHYPKWKISISLEEMIEQIIFEWKSRK